MTTQDKAVGDVATARTLATPRNINGVAFDGSQDITVTGVGGGGGDALTMNPLSQFAATTSAQLRGVLSDETGTGAAVFASAPAVTNPTITNYTETQYAIGTVTSSYTFDLTNGTVQTSTLTASTACTFTMPSAASGKSFTHLCAQAASTGNGTATYTSVDWGAAGAPTITATAGKLDIVTFISNGAKWFGSYRQGYTA